MAENELIEIIKNHCVDCEHNAGIECFARGEEEKCWEVKQRLIMSLRNIQEYQAIGTIDECRIAKEIRQKITETVNRYLIEGRNNYKEIYNCFYEIVKVIQDN